MNSTVKAGIGKHRPPPPRIGPLPFKMAATWLSGLGAFCSGSVTHPGLMRHSRNPSALRRARYNTSLSDPVGAGLVPWLWKAYGSGHVQARVTTAAKVNVFRISSPYLSPSTAS